MMFVDFQACGLDQLVNVRILMFVDDKLFVSPIAQDSKPVGCSPFWDEM